MLEHQSIAPLSLVTQQTHNKMVFEGGDVPLEEDILKKTVDFVSNEKEFSGRHRELIQKATTSNGDVTIFTVPPNKTLFITTAWISGSSDGVNVEAGFLTIYFNDVENSILGCSSGVKNEGNNSLGFPMPIQVNSGGKVFLESTSGNFNVAGGFTGWIEDVRLK